MKIPYILIFDDNTTEVVTIEKPAGAHPESKMAAQAAIAASTHPLKRVIEVTRESKFIKC